LDNDLNNYLAVVHLETDLAADRLAFLAGLESPPPVAAVDKQPWRRKTQTSLDYCFVLFCYVIEFNLNGK
jgi:hypothetical protein